VAAAAPNVHLEGLHYFWGSQARTEEDLAQAFEAGARSAKRICTRLGLDPEVLDLGGGFPWPYASDSAGPDVAALGPKLAELGSSLAASLPSARLWFESGRFLVASSGTLLARVVDLKATSRGQSVAVLDAGINAFAGLPALGRLMRTPVTIRSVAPAAPAHGGTVDVVGPLCTPADVLARAVQADGLHRGALVAVPNVGAYGLTASLVAFLGRALPAEVVCRGTAVSAVRRLTLSYEGSAA
jgi:diaminopimelate decarboxylase